MARETIDALYDRLTAVFPASRSYPRDAFEKEPMPQALAHFLTARLRQRAAQETEAFERSAWINHDHPEVREARHAFRETLEKHAQIPKTAWEAELRRAVEQVTAYLVRPVDTLARFVFEDEENAIPVREIMQKLRFFAAYPYLHEAVKAYIEQRDVGVLDRARFTSLLTRVDRQMTVDYAPEDWIRLLDPLFELSAVAYPKEDGVSISLLHTFFSAKDATASVQHLEGAKTQNGTRRLTREQLHQILEGRTPEEEAPEVEEAVPSPAPALSEPERADEPVPRWKQFRGGSPEKRAEPETSTATQAPPRPLWQQFRPEEAIKVSSMAHTQEAPESGREAPADLDELERVVLGPRGAKDRQHFIKHLFKGSREDYEAVLRRLRTVDSWSKASQVIAQEVFRKNQVNIYSDPAVAFTDAVEAQFR